MTETPFIRQVEVLIGPVMEKGPPAPGTGGQAIRIFGDGSNDHLRIRFRLNKHIVNIPLPGMIEIYNLGPELRDALQVPGISVTIRVGWQNTGLVKLYSGGIQSAWSHREGPDIITSLVCLSAFETTATAIVDGLTIKPNAGIRDIIYQLASCFDNIKVNQIDISVGNAKIGPRGYSFSGLASDCLDMLSMKYGFSWAIIDGNFQAVKDGSYLPGSITEINSQNGFLLRAEPVLQSAFQMQSGIIIHTLLNPNIMPGRLVNLSVSVNKRLDGSYKAQIVTHSGDTHSTQWETITETITVNAL